MVTLHIGIESIEGVVWITQRCWEECCINRKHCTNQRQTRASDHVAILVFNIHVETTNLEVKITIKVRY